MMRPYVTPGCPGAKPYRMARRLRAASTARKIGALASRTGTTQAAPTAPIKRPALLPAEWVTLDRFSDLWQHAREDFKAEVLFVSKTVGPSLDDADLVVDPFGE